MNNKETPNAETQYLSIMKDILENGTEVLDRTGTGTRKVFGRSIRHDYKNGFPLLTTKKMATKSIIGELLWFLKGTEDATFLIENKITIWDEWIITEPMYSGMPVGEYIGSKKVLPHTYGVKWRNFDGVDQIANVIDSLKTNPYSRRHVVSAWDPRNIDKAALPWCHVMFQFNVREHKDQMLGFTRYLDISVQQRSVDWFLGAPFNIASYSFLLYMIAEQVNMIPGEMYYTFGDTHLYMDHLEQANEQLHRIPYDCPRLILAEPDFERTIDDYKFEDFIIEGYKHHPAIKAEVSV